MPHIFEKHIAITPFHPDLVLNGVRAVKDLHPQELARLPWPQEKGVRRASGGDGGEIVGEQIQAVWQDNKLVFPISDSPQPVAERGRDKSIIQYNAYFLAQLDGEVAYQPAASNTDFYYILISNVDHRYNVIRFAADQTAIVSPGIKHSMPIPSRSGIEYTTYRRAVNAVLRFPPEEAAPPIFNIMKVDRQNLITAGKVQIRNLAGNHDHFSLPKNFSKKLLPLEPASDECFSEIGHIIRDNGHFEQPTETVWPGATGSENSAGILEQDFQMSWVPVEGGAQELVFKGLSGSFAGDEGKPGVEYQQDLGIYRANLLLTRPDSSFYVKTASTEATFAMVFALPRVTEKGKGGEPDEHTLRAFVFTGDQAIRLPASVWHSVPIPLATQESILLTEVVAATNANISIDVAAETGHAIQFAQAI